MTIVLSNRAAMERVAMSTPGRIYYYEYVARETTKITNQFTAVQSEIRAVTGLTTNELTKARKQLKSLGVVSERREKGSITTTVNLSGIELTHAVNKACLEQGMVVLLLKEQRKFFGITAEELTKHPLKKLLKHLTNTYAQGKVSEKGYLMFQLPLQYLDKNKVSHNYFAKNAGKFKLMYDTEPVEKATRKAPEKKKTVADVMNGQEFTADMTESKIATLLVYRVAKEFCRLNKLHMPLTFQAFRKLYHNPIAYGTVNSINGMGSYTPNSLIGTAVAYGIPQAIDYSLYSINTEGMIDKLLAEMIKIVKEIQPDLKDISLTGFNSAMFAVVKVRPPLSAEQAVPMSLFMDKGIDYKDSPSGGLIVTQHGNPASQEVTDKFLPLYDRYINLIREETGG